MNQTFERYWAYAGDVVNWTNSLLTRRRLISSACWAPRASCRLWPARIANGFDNPPDFFPWWSDPVACQQLIDQQLAKAA
jgi:hypothetical protein